MKLTLNFTLSELTHSDTANTKGISNQPPLEIVDNLEALANALQEIRDAIGVPITVSSGYRSAELNAEIGGSKTSAHLDGLAADIHAKGYSAREFAEFIIDQGIDFDQLILEYAGGKEWVHFGIRKPNRNQVLTYRNGQYQNGLV